MVDLEYFHSFEMLIQFFLFLFCLSFTVLLRNTIEKMKKREKWNTYLSKYVQFSQFQIFLVTFVHMYAIILNSQKT